MSADNWARCPRCTARESRRLEAREAEVQQLYGTVPVQEFDKARQILDEEMKEFERWPANFREDYEIYGAEDGTVTVDYAGSCRDCDLRLSFKDEHVIPFWDLPAEERGRYHDRTGRTADAFETPAEIAGGA